jgi:hypothetical protein
MSTGVFAHGLLPPMEWARTSLGSTLTRRARRNQRHSGLILLGKTNGSPKPGLPRDWPWHKQPLYPLQPQTLIPCPLIELGPRPASHWVGHARLMVCGAEHASFGFGPPGVLPLCNCPC